MNKGSRFTISNYNLCNLIEKGSFVHCFRAIHSEYGECAILVTNNLIDLQNRMNIYQKCQNLSGCMQLHEIVKANYSECNIDNLNTIYPKVFTESSYILSSKYYQTSYSFSLDIRPVDLKIKLFQKVVKQIQSFHELGVCHMDIKPSNIFIESSDPIIIDYGECVLSLNTIECVKNRSAYAPVLNMFDCNDIIPAKFDVYCLGAMFMEILLDKLPREFNVQKKQNYQQVVLKHGFAAADLLKGMLDPDQIKRYSIQQVLSHPVFTSYVKETDFRVLTELVKYKLLHSDLQNGTNDDNYILTKSRNNVEIHNTSVESVQNSNFENWLDEQIKLIDATPDVHSETSNQSEYSDFGTISTPVLSYSLVTCQTQPVTMGRDCISGLTMHVQRGSVSTQDSTFALRQGEISIFQDE
ncbi:Kinase [Hexamita inflata]|uniref:CAMK CAMKL n=1 Tax=Hexamita inflata TaxID=28002 RepID=A0AA86TER3_9EUKA|nr:CAMK CAMKL [Hexamita inflata]